MNNLEDINISYPVSQLDNGTTVITAAQTFEWIEQHSAELLKSALEQSEGKTLSSVIPTDSTTTQTLTLDDIDNYANGLNSSKDNLITVNAIILRKIIEDAFIGQAVQSIIGNINTDHKVVYDSASLSDKDDKELATVRTEVDYFLKSVNIRQVIRDAISTTYAEGNAPMTVRFSNTEAPVIDLYPLTIAYPSEYRSGGRSVIEFDVKTLKDRINKTYKKSKKTKKAIYFENMKAEVKANYPAEVSKAYEAGEDYVRLDPAYSDCVKINDFGRRFGVSPLFRCLRPLIVLEQIETADVSDSKARAKKILFQKLRKEVLGPDGTRKGLDQAAYAHQQIMGAIQTQSVVYTAAPFVEDVAYVQIKNTTEQSISQQKLYTQKLLTGLGIEFTDPNSTVSAGSISIKQLIRTINAIGESLECVLNKFLKTWVTFKGHDIRFVPTIRVIDAEQLEMDMRMELARLIYTTFNGPLSTSLQLIGLDAEDELAKRKLENEQQYEEVFFPRKTAYTNGGESQSPGRPKGDDTNGRQAYDETYSKEARE